MTRSTATVADWERLYAAARYHAQTALELQDRPWSDHAALDVATHAGSVVELLSKALLLTQDERLIADPSTVHQHLMDAIVERPSGRAAEGKKSVRKQTVAASVAVKLVSPDTRGVDRERPLQGADRVVLDDHVPQDLLPRAVLRPDAKAFVQRLPRPVFSGTSRHGAPVRSRHKIPLIT
jgi:hypothetical protein